MITNVNLISGKELSWPKNVQFESHKTDYSCHGKVMGASFQGQSQIWPGREKELVFQSLSEVISLETYFSDFVKLIGCLFSDVLITSSEVVICLLLELLLATLDVFYEVQSNVLIS